MDTVAGLVTCHSTSAGPLSSTVSLDALQKGYCWDTDSDITLLFPCRVGGTCRCLEIPAWYARSFTASPEAVSPGWEFPGQIISRQKYKYCPARVTGRFFPAEHHFP